MPGLAATMMRRMPPVLVLHGAADRVVPVEEARKLEQLLRDRGVPFEAHIYPGQGHGFTGEDRRDAATRVLDFFDRRLRH
jgi:carboxymethylenebutenolidase